MKYLKVAIFILNLLILLAGFMVVVIGFWLLLEPSNGHLLNLFVKSIQPHNAVHHIAYSLLALGFVVITVGFIGCPAVFKESHCMLIAYIVLLVVLIIIELAAAAVGGFLAYRGLSGLETRLLERLADHYGHDGTSDRRFTESLDYAQYKFNCCGIYGDVDYNTTAWARHGKVLGGQKHVPLTCCVLKNHEVRNAGSPMSVVSRVFNKDHEKPWLRPQPKDEAACQADSLEAQSDYRHKEGCMSKVRDWVQFESLKLVFMGLIMAAIQTIGIVVSAVLCRILKDRENA